MINLVKKPWNATIALFLSVCILFLGQFREAPAQTLNIQTYNVEDGLAQSQVQTIIQDQAGYLWFGTVDGLSRFNGKTIVNYTVKDGLSSNDVTACTRLHNGTIWFGHGDGKITVYSSFTQRFYKFRNGEKFCSGPITALFEDGKHRVWIGTNNNGIYKYENQKLFHFSRENGLPRDSIFSICSLDSNTICLGTENGLFKISDNEDSSRIKARVFSPENKQLQDKINSILLDSRGHLWIGTLNNGLFEYRYSPENSNNWTYRHYSEQSDFPSNWIQTIFEDQDHNILIGTNDEGIVKLTAYGNIRNPMYHFFYIDQSHGLPIKNVNAIYQDSEGNYWFGTDGGGVAEFRDSSFMLFTKKDGLPSNSVWAINQDKSGHFWIGTEKGLVTCKLGSGRLGKIRFKELTQKDSLTDYHILSIFTDIAGNLWIVKNGNGVTRLNPVTHQIKNFHNRNGIPFDDVTTIASDKNHNLWFGTFTHGAFVYKIKDKKFQKFEKKEELPGNRVNQIAMDHSGVLWFATNQGLTRYDGVNFQNFGEKEGIKSLEIISVAIDSSNHVWAGTSGEGVFVLNGTHSKNYNTKNGLSGDFIYTLVLDSNKYMWIGTSRGVDRFNLKDSTITHFGKREGFLGVECNQAAGFRDKYGTLWFGTIHGLVHFNPRSVKPNHVPPRVYITGVDVFYKRIPYSPNLKLSHRKNHLTFHFEAVGFTNPDLIKFQHRLKGFDKGWSPLNKQTQVIYPKLPPGHYVFEVRAQNGSGIWSHKTTKLSIRIRPPFWRTLWFMLIVVFVVFGGTYSTIRIRSNRNRARREYLESKIRERTRQLNEEKEKLQKTLNALASSEEKLKTVTSTVDAYLWSADVDEKGNIHYTLYTENVARITGYRAEEFLRRDSNLWFDIICPEDIEFAKESAKKMINGKPLSGAYRIRRKDGQIRWVYDRATPKTDESGRVFQINGVCVDITEIKQAQQALAESEAKFRTLAESTPIAIFIYRENYLYINPAMEKITGFSAEELFSKNFWEIIHPAFREIAKQRGISRLRGENPPWRYEFKFLTKSGEERWADFSTKGIVFNGEKAFLGTAIDITDRKKAEQSLQERESQLRTLINAMPDIVCFKDGKGRWIEANEFDLKLFQIENVPYRGKRDSELAEYSEFYRDAFLNCEKTDEAAWKKRTISRGDKIIPQPDGTEKIFDIIKVPIFNEDGSRKGLVVIGRDITEKRKMEQELLKADKLESLGLLAGGIAHDFNNILTGILGNISLAKMEINPDEEIYEILSEAENASFRAKDLTRQLLTFSKGGAPIRKAISISQLIKETGRFVLRGSNISFELNAKSNLWPADVDEGQISQVLNNLIINAKHAMPSGGIVRISAENVIVEKSSNLPLDSGRYIKISVEDQGMGIPREHLSKIFDPYFTTKQQGSGLGLASVYSIIKRHSGHIEVESELGKGTRFTLFLPASTELPEGTATKAEKSESGQGRILVMDDEKVIREVVSRMLKRMGYEVITTRNGRETLSVYRQALDKGKTFDLLILDLTIPGGMGGKETIRELLKINPEIKAVVSSGYSTDAIMADYRSFGFAGLVTKPFNIKELRKTLTEVLNNGEIS